MPPAIEALLSSPHTRIQGFLAAGHVCTVMGYEEYLPLAAKYKIPIVVTGFEPVDILQGVYLAVKQLEEKKHEVENQYSRVVQKKGNIPAKKLLAEVFDTVDRKWRGIGTIPQSGYQLKEAYADFDAEKIFKVENITQPESSKCIAGEVLQGLKNRSPVRHLEKSVRPKIRLARRWYRPKERALRIFIMERSVKQVRNFKC